MAFDPLDWLRTADKLMASGPLEADLRAAAGRYYYAVFLQSRLSLEFDGLLTPSKTAPDHAAVIRALVANRRGNAARALRALQRIRNDADYEPNIPFAIARANAARSDAQTVIRLCRPDWHRMAKTDAQDPPS